MLDSSGRKIATDIFTFGEIFHVVNLYASCSESGYGILDVPLYIMQLLFV